MTTPPLTQSENEAIKMGPIIDDFNDSRPDIATNSMATEKLDRSEAGHEHEHEPLITEPASTVDEESQPNGLGADSTPAGGASRNVLTNESVQSDRAVSVSEIGVPESDLSEKRVADSGIGTQSGEGETEEVHYPNESAEVPSKGNAIIPLSNDTTEEGGFIERDYVEVEAPSTEHLDTSNAAQGERNSHQTNVVSTAEDETLLEQDDTSTIGHAEKSLGHTEQGKGFDQDPVHDSSSKSLTGEHETDSHVQPTEGESLPQTAALPPQTSEASEESQSQMAGDQVSNNTQMQATSEPVHQTEGESPRQSRPTDLKPRSSLRRFSSRRWGKDRAIAEIVSEGEPDNSAFKLVVPPDGTPAEILVVRFNSWRQILKDISNFLKNAAQAEDNRSRDFMKMASSYMLPFRDSNSFEKSGGVQEMGQVLLESHKKQSAQAAENARIISNKLVGRIEQQREDLALKVKEVKHVSGDFRSNLGREIQTTRRHVDTLLQYLNFEERSGGEMSANQDPYTARLAVDRQLKLQLKEENYLQQAHLNLQASGKALERTIINNVQEVFAEYSSLVIRPSIESLTMLNTELDDAMDAIAYDQEWNALVQRDRNFVDPTASIRELQHIEYPGQKAATTLEMRSGPLERKTKYLRSYTSAWYVLTGSLFLHEYRSPDRTREITPLMSLHLPECKLGEHSEESSTSHKFVLKGKQSGQFHRDHSWVFRAESHEVMLSWYNDIQKLSALGSASPKERDTFVQSHQKESLSAMRENSNESADGLEHDEADEVPYSAPHSTTEVGETPLSPIRPEGGRFSSEANEQDRNLEATDSVKRTSNNLDENGLSGLSASRPQIMEDTVVNETNPIDEEGESNDTEAILVTETLRDADSSNGLQETTEIAVLTVEDDTPGTEGPEDLNALETERFDPLGVSSQEDSRAPPAGVQSKDLPIASQFANTSKEAEEDEADEADDLTSGLKSWAAADRALNDGESIEPVPGSFPETPAATSTA